MSANRMPRGDWLMRSVNDDGQQHHDGPISHHHMHPRGSGEDVEALSEPLTEEEQLDSRRVAQGGRLLAHEAMVREGLQVPVDGGQPDVLAVAIGSPGNGLDGAGVATRTR